MKLVIAAHYGDRRLKFDLPVGDGAHTFKWVGLAAAARIAANGAAGGIVRAREARASFPRNVALMPIKVWTDETEFHHPDHVVSEHLHDGQTLHIELTRRVAVDNVGAPNLTRWAIIAFATSEAQKQRREEAWEDELGAQAASRAKRDASERAKVSAQTEYKARAMRKVMEGQLHAVESIGRALATDWTAMNQSGAIDAWVRHPAEQAKIRALLVGKYVELNELFKTYAAASSSIGQTHEMEFIEFMQFVQDSGLFMGPGTRAPSQEQLMRAFSEALPEVGPMFAASGDRGYKIGAGVMQFAGFLNGIIKLSYMRYVDVGSRPGTPSSTLARRRSMLGKKDYTISQAVDGLLTEHIDSFMENNPKNNLVGTVVKRALGTNEVLAMFHDNETALVTVFRKYSANASTMSKDTFLKQIQHGLMTVQEFGLVCDDAKLTGGSNNSAMNDELTAREWRQAFAASQCEMEFGADDLVKEETKAAGRGGGGGGGFGGGGGGPSAAEREATLLSFPEFIEAVSRVGALKWEGNELTMAMKIEHTIHAIIQLAKFR